jgi:hypothetical protein
MVREKPPGFQMASFEREKKKRTFAHFFIARFASGSELLYTDAN